jgi:hypothetical protein
LPTAESWPNLGAYLISPQKDFDLHDGLRTIVSTIMAVAAYAEYYALTPPDFVDSDFALRREFRPAIERSRLIRKGCGCHPFQGRESGGAPGSGSGTPIPYETVVTLASGG